jgi:hypothetical protein
MTVYEKDKAFSPGWIFGGALIMIFLNVFAGLGIGLAGITASLWLFAGVGAACFILGGFIVGRWSAGSTILEAGLAAFVATLVSIGIHYVRGTVRLEPVAIAIVGLPPFLCGLLGGYIGEKVQGDAIEVQD